MKAIKSMEIILFCILILVTCHHTLSTSTLLSVSVLNNNDTFLCKQPPEIPRDYVVHSGLGAYKLYLSAKTWNDARKTCLNEGAHLAVITSSKEADILQKIQKGKRAACVWLGIHEQFKKDDWVTVFDQPLCNLEYVHWADGEPNNANNAGEHCVCASVNGMTDVKCDGKFSFICKIDLK